MRIYLPATGPVRSDTVLPSTGKGSSLTISDMLALFAIRLGLVNASDRTCHQSRVQCLPQNRLSRAGTLRSQERRPR